MMKKGLATSCLLATGTDASVHSGLGNITQYAKKTKVSLEPSTATAKLIVDVNLQV